VALKIETNAIIKKQYLKIALVKKLAPIVINNGVAIQCTKQIEVPTIPI
jgi:hypothetical protein